MNIPKIKGSVDDWTTTAIRNYGIDLYQELIDGKSNAIILRNNGSQMFLLEKGNIRKIL